MKDNNELLYSQQALFNRADFYNGLNDINLFVEDADSQYLYETVFKRLLGEDYNVKTIFPCGGKPGVIQMYEERGRFLDGTKNVYIVDGDFDSFLFPDKMIVDRHFVYLKKYNIESCVINEGGLCDIIKCKLKCVDEQAKRLLRFDYWKNRIINESKDLFLCYCYIQKYDLSIPNVDRSHYKFLDSKTGFKKDDHALEEYMDCLLKLDSEAAERIAMLKKEYIDRFGSDFEAIICGKFLLSSLHDYLRTIIKKTHKQR